MPATNRAAILTRPGATRVAPSVLAADFANMADECRTALGAGADLLHLDVMDGHFVPNLTMGPDLCRGLRKALPEAFLDVHLMVTNPGMFVEPFARAGADHISFHVEAVGEAGVGPLAERIRALGCLAGVVINPPTPVERVLPVVGLVDMVLVMSVNPGFGGQAFIEGSLDKLRRIRPLLRPEQRLEIDGGVSPENAGRVRDAGCDVLVAGSALFGKPREAWASIVAGLRGTVR